MTKSIPTRPRLVTRPFLAVAAAALAYFIADGITFPTTPRYVAGPLGGDELAVGAAVGAFAVTALVLRPVVGSLVDRHGRRPLLIAGAALFGAGMLGHLVADSLPLLIVMRVLLGAGEAAVFVSALSAISDLAPDARRGEAISYFSLSLYLGVGIGPLVGEALLGMAGFAGAWLAAAAMAGVAVLFALRAPETRPAAASRDDRSPAAASAARHSSPRHLVHPAGIVPGLVLLASTAGMGGFFAFVPLYSDQLGMDGSRLAFLLLAAIVVTFRVLMPWMPDRLGARRASSAALALDALGLLVIAAWATPAGLFVGTAIFALGISFAFPALSMMAVASVAPSERGAVLGTFTAFLDLAFGLGPVILGLAAQAAGYGAMFLTASIIAAGGLAILRLAGGRRPISSAARTDSQAEPSVTLS